MRKLIVGSIVVLGMLAFTGCGSSGSSSGSSTPPAQPEVPVEPPLSNNGNQKLLPGYTYTCDRSSTYEMYISEPGNVLFAGSVQVNVFDENFNAYTFTLNGYDYSTTSISSGSSANFDAGQYYLVPWNCPGGSGTATFTVQSNVLY